MIIGRSPTYQLLLVHRATADPSSAVAGGLVALWAAPMDAIGYLSVLAGLSGWIAPLAALYLWSFVLMVALMPTQPPTLLRTLRAARPRQTGRPVIRAS